VTTQCHALKQPATPLAGNPVQCGTHKSRKPIVSDSLLRNHWLAHSRYVRCKTVQLQKRRTTTVYANWIRGYKLPASPRVVTAEHYKEKKSHKEYNSTFFTAFPGVSVPSKSTIHSLMEKSWTFSLLQKKRQRTRRVPSDVRSARLKHVHENICC
jgi:hypothetical protein